MSKDYGYVRLKNKTGSLIDENNPLHVVDSTKKIPASYNKQTSNSSMFVLQKGQLNKLRIRPQILNEHCESSREVQAVVNASTIVGQVFKQSQDNINGINLAMESAGYATVDDFEGYADSAELEDVWVEGNDAAVLDTIFFSPNNNSTQCMKLDGGSTANTWTNTITSTDLTGFTASYDAYFEESYITLKLGMVLIDNLGNTKSFIVAHQVDNAWVNIQVNENAFIDDQGTPMDITKTVGLRFEIVDARLNRSIWIDNLQQAPAPGTVKIKLWDMGSELPTEADSIDNGTQYTKLGDLGITGQQVAEVEVQLLGGFRIYHIDNFVAGVALEIPDNELLVPNNYYAITINHVDTNVSVYGPNTSYNTKYYNNGFAFTASDENTAISKIGDYSDLMFVIFSTQNVYVVNVGQKLNASPNADSSCNIYIEDCSMRRTAILLAGSPGSEVIDIDVPNDAATFMEKGSKLEEEYNDAFTDTALTKAVLGFRYRYAPVTVNG